MARLRGPATLLIGVVGCASPANVPAPESPAGAVTPDTIVVSVVGTNDIHGRIGRLPVLAGFVDNLRASRADDGAVILVDAGDAFQGTLESDAHEGATVIHAFNVMGYDVMTLGNHEFDFGPAGPISVPRPADDANGALKARLSQARFPMLSANLVMQDGKPPPWTNLAPSTMVRVAGLNIGIVGALTAGAADVIKQPNFRGLRTAPLGDAIVREARELRERGAHAVIAVTHAGGHCDRVDDPRDLSSCEPDSEVFTLARGLPPGTVDAIFAGHRSQSVAHFVGEIPIVQSPTGLLAFSRIDLQFDADTKRIVGRRLFAPHALCQATSEHACNPGSYEGAPVRENARVRAAVEPGLRSAMEARSRKLGSRLVQSMSAFKRAECPMGNLFVDLMRAAVDGADGAVANGGSLRSDLPVGELTYGQVHRAMPFDNQIATVRLSGAQLREIIRTNVTQNEHGILSVSGFRSVIECVDGAVLVSLEREDGTVISDTDELKIVTSDFLGMGGDGLLRAAGVPADAVHLHPDHKVRDVLVEGLRARPRWNPSDASIFDPSRPRLALPGGFPVRCER